MIPRRPIVRYVGGKFRLADWLIGHFPPHRIYVEPYAGGASVLLRKPRSCSEVYNDLRGEVVNVFRVLRQPEDAMELERRIRLTPFARDEFRRCTEEAWLATQDPIERARMTIFRSFAGFSSASMGAGNSTGFRANSRRSGTTPAHDWAHYPDEIPVFVERLAAVVIESMPAIHVMRQHDSLETLHYVDPPYVHSSRQPSRSRKPLEYGQFEMDDGDHRELADCLHDLRGMVVLSGYRSDLYDELFSDWERRERGHFADGARKRVECIWLNGDFAPQRRLDEARKSA